MWYWEHFVATAFLSLSLFSIGWIRNEGPLTVKGFWEDWKETKQQQQRPFTVEQHCSDATHLMNYTICAAFSKHNVRQPRKHDIKINWCCVRLSFFERCKGYTHTRAHITLRWEKKLSDLLWPIDFFGNHWTLEFEEWCQIVRANISSEPVESLSSGRERELWHLDPVHIHLHSPCIEYTHHATNVTNILIWKQSNDIFAVSPSHLACTHR